MSNLDRVKKILANLSEQVVENGCTEDEALNAAEMLANLLAKHGLTLEEIEDYKRTGATSDGQSMDIDYMPVGKKTDEMRFVLNAIAKLFNLYVGVHRQYPSREVFYMFVGFDEDRLCAQEVLRIVGAARDNAYKAYLRANPGESRSLSTRHSFMSGFCLRMSARIMEIVDQRLRRDGTLIVCKQELILSTMQSKINGFQHEGTKKAVLRLKSAAAMKAGEIAADLVDLGLKEKIA